MQMSRSMKDNSRKVGGLSVQNVCGYNVLGQKMKQGRPWDCVMKGLHDMIRNLVSCRF